MEMSVTKDLMEIKVIKEGKEAKAQRVILEIEVTKVQEVIKVIRERKVRKVPMVILA